MEPTLQAMRMPIERGRVDRRLLGISGLCVGLGLVAAVVARLLTSLIGLITNLAFHGTWSTAFSSPAGNSLGWLVVLVPVVGGLVVGVMARYGSKAIRGHGIPEAMEQVLFNESRIPARVTLLKPLSAAVSIGTGGRSGPRGPSSRPAARSARCSARCCASRSTSGRPSSPRARRRACRRRSRAP
jgi:H+/Cl- antiporter ClcA